MTQFTQDELKLISRALNFYSKHPEYISADRRETEQQASKDLATRIYKENFRLGGHNV